MHVLLPSLCWENKLESHFLHLKVNRIKDTECKSIMTSARKGARNRQFTKLQGLETFKHPAHDVWGFYSSRKETQRGPPASPKQKNITFPESWLGRLHRAEFTLLRSALGIEGCRGVKSRCTSGLKDPQSPVSPGHTTLWPPQNAWGFLPAPTSWPFPHPVGLPCRSWDSVSPRASGSPVQPTP